MRMMATPEGRVKARLNARTKQEFGANLFRFMPVQNGMGAPGLDYFYCINGMFISAETKVPGKDLTPRQKYTAACIQRAGGRVYEIRTNNDIENFIYTVKFLCGYSKFDSDRVLPQKDYSEFLPNHGESNEE